MKSYCLQCEFRILVRNLTSEVVGLTGLEPVTPRLSSACSNQLSYTPWRAKPAFQISNMKFEIQKLVELRRLELPTYSLQSYRSTN